MARARWILGIGALGAGAAAIAVMRTRSAPAPDPTRWNVVSIEGADALLTATEPPPPLDRLGDRIQWRVVAAPGDKGVELRARPTASAAREGTGAGGDDRETRREVRSALREAKQLIEVGEVLRRDPAPEGKRSATPGGALVDALSRKSGEEGVL